MAYNIASQNENGAFAGLMSAFHLSSMEEYDSRAQKISVFLFVWFGHRPWGRWMVWFQSETSLKKRLNCTKNKFLEQFKKAFVCHECHGQTPQR